MNPDHDIAGLVEQLRAAGFHVDTRQYLTAHELLLAYAARGRRLEDDAAALISHLGPVFCTSPEEQSRFTEAARAWLGPPPARVERRRRPRRPFAPWRHRRWLLPLLILGLMVLSAVLGGLFYGLRPLVLEGGVWISLGPERSEPAPEAVLRLDGRPVPLDAQGRFSLTLRRWDGRRELTVELAGYPRLTMSVDPDLPSPLELTLKPAPPPPEPPRVLPDSPIRFGQPLVIPHPPGSAPVSTVVVTDWASASVAGGLLMLLTYALWALAERLRRHLVLRRLPAGERPDIRALAADAPAPPVLDERAFRRVVADLRRPREQVVQDLDVPASVRATARSGGLFQAVWKARRAMPEYLALIGRHDPEDHQARLAGELMRRLAQRGVAIDVLHYRDDPRLCLTEDGAHCTLGELGLRHHRAVLFLFAEAARCFNPVTGRPEDWLEACTAWPRRVLFTPVPPAHWTQQEWRLAAEGWLVLPAGEAGLAAYAAIGQEWRIDSLFPAPYARPYPSLLSGQPGRWLDRNPPPEATLERLVRELRGYLGADGFGWLAACAVYPEIAWPITLHLGGVLPGLAGRPDRLAALLPALARLPWFRKGAMPDWLRTTLIALLPPQQEKAVRRALEQILEQMAERILGGSQDRGLRIGRWIGPVDVLRSAPEGSPLRDTVFLGYMARTDVDRLAVLAPRSLARLFRQVGLLPAGRPDQLLQATGNALARLLARARGWLLFRPVMSRALVSLLLGLGSFVWLAREFTRAVDLPSAVPHTGYTAVAFSPDSRLLATGSLDQVARVVDARTGALIASLVGHAGGIVDLAFSPDGTRLVTASEDGSAKVWETGSGRLLHVLEGHEGRVNSAQFSPDGGRVLTASSDGTARVWDLVSGRQLAALSQRPTPVSWAAFSPDGQRLVTASADGVARIWNAADGRLLRELAGGEGPLRSAVFTLDGRRVLGIAENGAIRSWEADSGRLLVSLPGPGVPVITAAYLPDHAWGVTVGEDGVTRIWDASQGRVQASLPGTPGLVRQARISPDDRTLAVVRQDEVMLWPLEARAPVTPPVTRTPPADSKTSAAKTPDIAFEVKVPSLLGLDLAAARALAARAGLRIGRITTQTRLTRATPGTVVGQSPAAGTLLKRGSAVDLRVQGEPAPAAAKQPLPGWCCFVGNQGAGSQPNGVFAMDEQECKRRNGLFYREEAAAMADCARFAGLDGEPVQQAPLPRGWEGVDIAEIQALLARAGYYKGPQDGRLRDELVKALMQFQEANGLTPDGLPGRQTLDLLRNPGKAEPVPNAPSNVRAL